MRHTLVNGGDSLLCLDCASSCFHRSNQNQASVCVVYIYIYTSYQKTHAAPPINPSNSSGNSVLRRLLLFTAAVAAPLARSRSGGALVLLMVAFSVLDSG